MPAYTDTVIESEWESSDTDATPSQIHYDDNAAANGLHRGVRRTPAGPHDWPWRDSANGMRLGDFVPNHQENFSTNNF